MNEFFQRLKLTPGLTLEIGIASLFANILALAAPLFVIQVLNRYVAYGVDATLLTLTIGVLIAISLEYAFRKIRMRLCRSISAGPNANIANASYNILLKVKASALEQIPMGQRQQIISATSSVEKAYGSDNIGTVFDVPFAFLFIAALFFLSALLSGIVVCFLIGIFITGRINARRLQKNTRKLIQTSGTSNALINSAIAEIDTVRAFNASTFLSNIWSTHINRVQNLRGNTEILQGGNQTFIQTATSLMSVLIISIGATMVVASELDVGAMIGANILATRALMPVSRFSQLSASFAEASESILILKEFAKLPLESESGSSKETYKGGLEFRDLAFNFPGARTPLFESLSLNVKPNTIVVIRGSNGTGKTTLIRLITGIIEPTRGHIFSDGLDLRQASSEWWRRQFIYLPQEPSFLNATIRDNLITVNSKIEEQQLLNAVKASGLKEFFDESPLGLETQIIDNGKNLSLGIRRRLAMARALLTDGMLVVFDEPTEGLDREGVACVYSVLNSLSLRGRTIIVVSHDPKIVKGAHVAIDLDAKPVPKISHRSQTANKKTAGKM